MIRAFAIVLIAAVAAPAGAQTLFTTEDYRKDRDRWTDPAYYRFNTARELTDMQVDNRFGQEGAKADQPVIRSPYPYRTSWEHFEALREKAGGGTKHTLATLPDWDGQWRGGASWLDGRNIQASTIAAALTPQYREYYVQQVKAEAEGRHWWAASFCLPDGFIRGVQRAQQFVVRPGQVLLVSDMLVANQVRWVFTDSRGHLPEAEQYPQWQGESIGFWDGDALVIHTNQIKQWTATHAMFEWSDQMTAVERYQRVGNDIVGELTLYDPVAFMYPLHVRYRYTRQPDTVRPVYSTCTDTNGPSSNVFVRPDGILDERVPGDPGYWDPTDPRPWAVHYEIGERHQAATRSGR